MHCLCIENLSWHGMMHACSAFILSGCLTQVLLYTYIANNLTLMVFAFKAKVLWSDFVIYTAEVIRLNKQQFLNKIYWPDKGYMGLVATKPVFRVSDKSTLKPVSSATETSYRILKFCLKQV